VSVYLSPSMPLLLADIVFIRDQMGPSTTERERGMTGLWDTPAASKYISTYTTYSSPILPIRVPNCSPVACFPVFFSFRTSVYTYMCLWVYVYTYICLWMSLLDVVELIVSVFSIRDDWIVMMSVSIRDDWIVMMSVYSVSVEQLNDESRYSVLRWLISNDGSRYSVLEIIE